MSRHSRRSLLAAAGTALAGALAGCSGLNPLSGEASVEYDESALADLPDDLPRVPAAVPVQPTAATVADARERVRSLLDGADVSRVPNEVVREKLARSRESAREALSDDDTGTARVDALAGLTYPRGEAMFVHAGLAAFDGSLTAADVADRRERHHRETEAFLEEYRYVGPPGEPVGAFAEHARIVDWTGTGVRLTAENRRHEYENTVLHAAELAQDGEWGRAYAADARRLREQYVSMLDDPREYGERFSRVADDLVGDVERYADEPDWEALRSGFDRDIENTVAEDLLVELADGRWNGSRNAVEDHDDGRETLAVLSAMRALTADRALGSTREAISDGAYAVPESVEPIAAERTAAVANLRTLLDSSPALLARRLANRIRARIRNADEQIREGSVPAPGRYVYGDYALANRLGAAAPAVVRRVGDALDG